MARRIIKKIGSDRLGSGPKMIVEAHGFGVSTHDVSKTRRTSMSFGTIVPAGMWLMPAGSRLRLNLDALITSNALLYQLYGSAKFQADIFSSRFANYNAKMDINLNDQAYEVDDIKFPQMRLRTRGFESNMENISNRQVNPSSLLRYTGVSSNGQNAANWASDVERVYMAMWILMYYQTYKEYYANKQEKRGLMIHNVAPPSDITIVSVEIWNNGEYFDEVVGWSGQSFELGGLNDPELRVRYVSQYRRDEEQWTDLPYAAIVINSNGMDMSATAMWQAQARVNDPNNETAQTIIYSDFDFAGETNLQGYRSTYATEGAVSAPQLTFFDLKAIDRMTMKILKMVDSTEPLEINSDTELPYGASFKEYSGFKSINGTQEGLVIGTYQSDIFNNWLDNTTINNLNAKNKVKVDENGEFSIDMLNITQKMYNIDMRIGITDGTLDEWRELTYGQKTKSKSKKPVFNGSLTKEIVFDQVVSTAGTEQEPLGSIASRGQFGSKHKGGYAMIDAGEETLVMVLMKITPRIVYNQGNDWTLQLKTLDDIHKPGLDKIGYQNLLTDQMFAAETVVNSDGSLVTQSIGKLPAWMWYRTNYDDALGNMADTEDYKVFGRNYSGVVQGGKIRLMDATTYIDPMKYNDKFALKSLDAMNFDVQIGMDAKMTVVMSEEIIPNL